MATHTRPFACNESGCTSRPFGDKAGLVRHGREVHGKSNRGQPAQTFACPEVNCKRHHRGFAREYNMLEHHRRIHEEPTVDGVVVKAQGFESVRDQMRLSSRAKEDSPSGGCSESNDSALETADKLSGHRQGSSGTTLQVLRAELERLKAQRERALQTFDEEIEALSTSLRIMERSGQNAAGNE